MNKEYKRILGMALVHVGEILLALTIAHVLFSWYAQLRYKIFTLTILVKLILSWKERDP